MSLDQEIHTHIFISYRPVLQVHGLGQEVDPDGGLLDTEKDTSLNSSEETKNFFHFIAESR